jgi:hypothetical protein
VTLKRCIVGAYGVRSSQFIGGPDWLGSERFEITAKGEPLEERAMMGMLQTRPVNVANGIQCYTYSIDYLLCRSALRWPSRIVSADFGQGMLPVGKTISYSPFPAFIDVSTIENTWRPVSRRRIRLRQVRPHQTPRRSSSKNRLQISKKTSNSRTSLCAHHCRLLFTSTPPLSPLDTGNEVCSPIETPHLSLVPAGGACPVTPQLVGGTFAILASRFDAGSKSGCVRFRGILFETGQATALKVL